MHMLSHWTQTCIPCSGPSSLVGKIHYRSPDLSLRSLCLLVLGMNYSWVNSVSFQVCMEVLTHINDFPVWLADVSGCSIFTRKWGWKVVRTISAASTQNTVVSWAKSARSLSRRWTAREVSLCGFLKTSGSWIAEEASATWPVGPLDRSERSQGVCTSCNLRFLLLASQFQAAASIE